MRFKLVKARPLLKMFLQNVVILLVLQVKLRLYLYTAGNCDNSVEGKRATHLVVLRFKICSLRLALFKESYKMLSMKRMSHDVYAAGFFRAWRYFDERLHVLNVSLN